MYKDKICDILKKIKGNNFDITESLISKGFLNSYELAKLIIEIELVFHINISLDEVLPEKFDSVRSINEVVEKYTITSK